VSTLRYIRDNWDTLGPETQNHIRIVVICMLASGAIGLLLGVVAARNERFAGVSLGITSTILTVPSLALFGLLTIWLGLSDTPVIIGLVLYALLPTLRNTRTGIRAVEPAVIEAARGMGMRPWQVLLRVELPLALPVILAGLRQATVMVIAITTVGSEFGSDNLGRPIFSAVGRTTGSYERLLSGLLPVAALGILADASLALVQRLLSRGRITSVPAT
jgi:osmoprotectant transport system permease protein